MWFASTPVALWHYVTVLRVTPGLFGDHLVSGSLKGAMCAPLHVLLVLLCSLYRAFSRSLHFCHIFSSLYNVHNNKVNRKRKLKIKTTNSK